MPRNLPEPTPSRTALFELLDALAEYGRSLREDEHAEAPRGNVRLTSPSARPEAAEPEREEVKS